MKTNVVHVLAAAALIPFLAPLGFSWWTNFPWSSALEISGISGATIGTLWLAAGVLVSRKELRRLTAESRKKAIANIKNTIATASRHVWLGVIYTVLGSTCLVLSVLDAHFRWL